MNSKQRRQFNRKFKHEVVLFHRRPGQRSLWTERLTVINERLDWCEKNVGKNGEHWIHVGYDLYKFKDARMATWFKLKFS